MPECALIGVDGQFMLLLVAQLRIILTLPLSYNMPFLCNATSSVYQHQWKMFTGLQTFVMTLQGPVVALAAQGHLLATVWHHASPSSTDDQCLHYAVYDVGQQQQVRCLPQH